MNIAEFRAQVTELVSHDELTDDEFWTRVGDLSIEVLRARADVKRRPGGTQVNIFGDNHAPIIF